MRVGAAAASAKADPCILHLLCRQDWQRWLSEVRAELKSAGLQILPGGSVSLDDDCVGW